MENVFLVFYEPDDDQAQLLAAHATLDGGKGAAEAWATEVYADDAPRAWHGNELRPETGGWFITVERHQVED